jgi:hypothetical protein
LPSGRLLVARQDRVPQSRRLDLFDVHGSRIASWPHPVKSFVVHANGLHALGRDGWSQHSEDGTVLAAGPPAPSQLSAAAVGPGSRLLVSERSGRLTAWDDPTNPAWYADVGSLPSAITPLDDGGAIIATTGAPANSAAAAGADAHQILPRIIRFDHAGRVLWSRTLDAAAIDVRLHQDGSVLVTLSGPDRATDGEFLGRSAVVCIGADGTTRWHAGFAVGDPIEALEPEADGGAIIGFRSGMVRWVDPEGAILRSHTLPGRVAQFMRLDDGSLLAAVHDRQPLVLLTP